MSKASPPSEERGRSLTFELASIAILLAVIDTCLFTQRHPDVAATVSVAVDAIVPIGLSGAPYGPTGMFLAQSR